MRARNVSLGSMFGWIPATFKMVFGHFGAMALAAIMTLLVILACTLPIVFWQVKSMMAVMGTAGGAPPVMGTSFWITYALCILVSMVVMAPISAGWMRMCHSADRGQAVSPMQLFGVFRDFPTWGRLLLYTVLIVLVAAVLMLLLYPVFGGLFKEMMALQQAQQAAIAAGSAPPTGDPSVAFRFLGAFYLVGLPLMMVVQLIYMVGMAEVSLRSTPALGALAEASGGVLRNLLKLIVLGICLFIAFFIMAIVFGIVAAIGIGALMMASPMLMYVAAALIYLAIIVVIYPLMFSSNYLVWKDMLGDTSPPSLTL